MAIQTPLKPPQAFYLAKDEASASWLATQTFAYATYYSTLAGEYLQIELVLWRNTEATGQCCEVVIHKRAAQPQQPWKSRPWIINSWSIQIRTMLPIRSRISPRWAEQEGRILLTIYVDILKIVFFLSSVNHLSPDTWPSRYRNKGNCQVIIY